MFRKHMFYSLNYGGIKLLSRKIRAPNRYCFRVTYTPRWLDWKTLDIFTYTYWCPNLNFSFSAFFICKSIYFACKEGFEPSKNFRFFWFWRPAPSTTRPLAHLMWFYPDSNWNLMLRRHSFYPLNYKTICGEQVTRKPCLTAPHAFQAVTKPHRFILHFQRRAVVMTHTRKNVPTA